MGPELDEQDSKLGMITKKEFQSHLPPLQRYMHFPIKGQGGGGGEASGPQRWPIGIKFGASVLSSL